MYDSTCYSPCSYGVLLPYLSVTMHFIQYQCDVISFAGYYVIACCTLTASITMHFYWLIQHAITEGCYAVQL